MECRLTLFSQLLHNGVLVFVGLRKKRVATHHDKNGVVLVTSCQSQVSSPPHLPHAPHLDTEELLIQTPNKKPFRNLRIYRWDITTSFKFVGVVWFVSHQDFQLQLLLLKGVVGAVPAKGNT